MAELAEIKIISDGTRQGTKVLDSAGRYLQVREITWRAAMGGVPEATLTIVGIKVDLELTGDVEPTSDAVVSAPQTAEDRKVIVSAVREAKRNGELA